MEVGRVAAIILVALALIAWLSEHGGGMTILGRVEAVSRALESYWPLFYVLVFVPAVLIRLEVWFIRRFSHSLMLGIGMWLVLRFCGMLRWRPQMTSKVRFRSASGAVRKARILDVGAGSGRSRWRWIDAGLGWIFAGICSIVAMLGRWGQPSHLDWGHEFQTVPPRTNSVQNRTVPGRTVYLRGVPFTYGAYRSSQFGTDVVDVMYRNLDECAREGCSEIVDRTIRPRSAYCSDACKTAAFRERVGSA